MNIRFYDKGTHSRYPLEEQRVNQAPVQWLEVL